MIDANVALRVAQAHAKSWTVSAALEVSRDLKRSTAATLDFDSGAGETWIRIIDQGRVIALISTVIPVAFVETNFSNTDVRNEFATTIGVPDMDSPCLCACRETLSDAFGESSRLDSIDLNGFSAHDLWFATV
ncbi:hypothetical protein Rhe02_36610 [Rhizocola hellebori]|uniref:Uncharacterized protein n=1 Tax=Rhizocola hellebori TaxID=1392758 RepID=A0A8J3Q7S8_9ACTN|nr:hypothetical protein [Rhizocola hellebori]GIH05594.1 hypothetical protein Rhe02_36610 [Rhizocola hellebori]